MDKQIFTSVPIEELMAALRTIVREELATPQASIDRKDECITGKELCSFLGISEPTLIRWRAKGKIPFLEMGGVLRYDKNKVVKALESSKNHK